MHATKHRILWIDGLGGFLLCFDFPATIGGAHAAMMPDIPIQANLSRKHAVLHQESEGFSLERGEGLVEMQGQPVGRTLLAPRAKVQLGGSCEIEFHQSIPGGSARLEVTRGGRILYPVRAVLLISQSFSFASNPTQGDLLVPDLERPVSLFRGKGGLEIRTAGESGMERHLLESGKTVKLRELTTTLEEVPSEV